MRLDWIQKKSNRNFEERPKKKKKNRDEHHLMSIFFHLHKLRYDFDKESGLWYAQSQLINMPSDFNYAVWVGCSAWGCYDTQALILNGENKYKRSDWSPLTNINQQPF